MLNALHCIPSVHFIYIYRTTTKHNRATTKNRICAQFRVTFPHNLHVSALPQSFEHTREMANRKAFIQLTKIAKNNGNYSEKKNPAKNKLSLFGWLWFLFSLLLLLDSHLRALAMYMVYGVWCQWYERIYNNNACFADAIRINARSFFSIIRTFSFSKRFYFWASVIVSTRSQTWTRYILYTSDIELRCIAYGDGMCHIIYSFSPHLNYECNQKCMYPPRNMYTHISQQCTRSM